MPNHSTSENAAISPQQEVARLAEMRAVHGAFLYLHNQEMEFRRWQMELAAVPAPPFGEAARSQWLRLRFLALGLHDVHVDELGNVFGQLYPESTAPVLAISAHIDTVFPADTPFVFQEQGTRLLGPGISDNASGVVAMMAVASALRQSDLRLSGNVVFIGNVGEEGEGNLRGMRHIFADDRWSNVLHRLLVIDGAGTDTYVNQALGSKRFEITFRGPGGHSWSDFGTPNPILFLCRALARFGETTVPENPRTTFNIGVVRGGTSVNSIPETASARVDLRSASKEELDKLETRLRSAVSGAHKEGLLQFRNAGKGISVDIESIGDRPAAQLSKDARMLQVIRAVDAHLGIHSLPRLASTDANIPLSLGREAITIGAGGDGGGAHTLREWFDCSHRDLGLKRILLALLALTGVNE